MKAILTGDATFDIVSDDIIIRVTRYDTGVQVDFIRDDVSFQSILTPVTNNEVIQ